MYTRSLTLQQFTPLEKQEFYHVLTSFPFFLVEICAFVRTEGKYTDTNKTKNKSIPKKRDIQQHKIGEN